MQINGKTQIKPNSLTSDIINLKTYLELRGVASNVSYELEHPKLLITDVPVEAIEGAVSGNGAPLFRIKNSAGQTLVFPKGSSVVVLGDGTPDKLNYHQYEVYDDEGSAYDSNGGYVYSFSSNMPLFTLQLDLGGVITKGDAGKPILAIVDTKYVNALGHTLCYVQPMNVADFSQRLIDILDYQIYNSTVLAASQQVVQQIAPFLMQRQVRVKATAKADGLLTVPFVGGASFITVSINGLETDGYTLDNGNNLGYTLAKLEGEVINKGDVVLLNYLTNYPQAEDASLFNTIRYYQNGVNYTVTVPAGKQLKITLTLDPASGLEEVYGGTDAKVFAVISGNSVYEVTGFSKATGNTVTLPESAFVPGELSYITCGGVLAVGTLIKFELVDVASAAPATPAA